MHKNIKGQLKSVLKKLGEMQNYTKGKKTAILYCEHCLMPSIEEKTIPMPKRRGRPKKNTPKALREMTELIVKWCVFCEEPVKPKVMYRKNYITLIKRVDLIYRGLRKNK